MILGLGALYIVLRYFWKGFEQEKQYATATNSPDEGPPTGAIADNDGCRPGITVGFKIG